MATDTKTETTARETKDTGLLDQVLEQAAGRTDLAVLRLENESITAQAQAYPRDHKAILKEIEDQFEAYPSLAAKAIYSKPVGKDEQGRPKFVRGLSIRTAETIAEAYGYNRIRADVSILDPGHVRIEASFTDFQNGRVWLDSNIVSRHYKAKNGRNASHSDDRFFNVVVKAEKSKCLREVILRSVPAGLKAEVEILAERKIDEVLDEGTVEKIVMRFANKNVTLEQLEKHVGRTQKAGWTKDDRKQLLGIWTAVEQEETTVAETFGNVDAETEERKAPQLDGAVNGDDLTQPQLATE